MDFVLLSGLQFLALHCKFDEPVNHTLCFLVKPLGFYYLDCFSVSMLKWICLLGNRSKCWLSESVIRVLDTVYPNSISE